MGIGSSRITQKDFVAIAGDLGRKKKGGKQETCYIGRVRSAKSRWVVATVGK
jgi:hypothetical protein